MSGRIRVVNWNLEWAPPSRRERIAVRLSLLAPDILCATEADREILPAGGHVAECEPDSGYGVKGGRRKGILWSRWPLDDIDPVGARGLPRGRFVAATCRTPGGPIRLMALCIPWSHALVKKEGRGAWEDHLTYLEHLGPLLRDRDRSVPTLLLGDFNQRIPRSRSPQAAYDALMAALEGFSVVTEGRVAGIDRPVIDHVAHCPLLRADDLRGFDRLDDAGRPLSDHDGVALTIAIAPPPAAGPDGPAADGGSDHGRK